MNCMRNYKKMRAISGRGFGLAEIVIGAAIVSLALFGIIASVQIALRVSEESLSRTRASFLLEEGVEAARVLRDAGWSANIAGLVPGTRYYPAFSGGLWRATTTNIYIGGFERYFVLDNVYRNGSDDIAASGTLDANTRKVSVFVSWVTRTGTTTESVSTYLTNLFAN